MKMFAIAKKTALSTTRLFSSNNKISILRKEVHELRLEIYGLEKKIIEKEIEGHKKENNRLLIGGLIGLPVFFFGLNVFANERKNTPSLK